MVTGGKGEGWRGGGEGRGIRPGRIKEGSAAQFSQLRLDAVNPTIAFIMSHSL